MKILVAMEVTEKHKTLIEAAAGTNTVVYADVQGPVSALVKPQDLADAEVIIGNVKPSLLQQAKQLRWLQLNSAGANTYCGDGILPAGTLLTNATGAYGLALAEHMLAQLLAMMKRLYAYYDNQKQALWRDEGPVTSLYGATAVIVGYGDIGSQLGRRLQALGTHVIGIRRRSVTPAQGADEMALITDLDRQLAKADIVASCLPDTPETYHLYDAARFGKMKKGAWFLNIGRGSNVVQQDLCAAVTSGHLAGAAVDVTDPEPLPAADPLWRTEGIYITPHISGGYHVTATHDAIVRIAVDNLKAYINGKPLQNEVDFTTGYKK